MIFELQFLTVPQAARVLGMHRDTVVRAIRRGEIPARMILSKYRIPIAALRDMGAAL